MGGEDPVSNVNADTGLLAAAESAGASARHPTQGGRSPGETIFSALHAGVACVRCISKDGVQYFEVQ